MIAGLFALHPSAAHALESKLQCVESHEHAQTLRREGHLRAARLALLVCTRPGCPSVIQKECGPWLDQVTAEQPSLVVSVRDPSGADVTAVQVSVDGEAVTAQLDGRPIDLDPGEHTLRFELPGGKAMDRRVVLREGEKGRPLLVDFSPARPGEIGAVAAPNREPEHPSHANTIAASVLGVVGIAVLGGAVALAVAQNEAASNAHAACGVSCASGSAAATSAQSDVRSSKTERVWEGVSFGFAGAFLGLAAYVFLAQPLSMTTAARTSASVSGLTFDLSPRAGAVRWRINF